MSKEVGESERYFFIYAFPALSPESVANHSDYEELMRMFHKGDSPSKDELSILFPHAFRRVRDWSIEGIREYWWVGHTKLMEEVLDEYRGAFKIQCKVKPASIVSLASEFSDVIFKREEVSQKVFVPDYLSDLSQGNYVTVRLRWMVEKISRKQYDDF